MDSQSTELMLLFLGLKKNLYIKTSLQAMDLGQRKNENKKIRGKIKCLHEILDKKSFSKAPARFCRGVLAILS